LGKSNFIRPITSKLSGRLSVIIFLEDLRSLSTEQYSFAIVSMEVEVRLVIVLGNGLSVLVISCGKKDNSPAAKIAG
jgi:hypothetical protein